MRFLRASLPFFLFTLVFVLMPAQGASQTTAQEILAKSKGKRLFLRGLWSCDHLRFNASGQIAKPCRSGSFSESGFQLDSVKLTQNGVRLDGHRFALTFDDKGLPQSAPVMGKMRIEIDGTPGQDYGEAIETVITQNFRSMLPTLPDYWQPWARKMVGSGPREIPGVSHISSPKDKGSAKAVLAPHVLYAPEPEFSEEARAAKFSGDVQVYLIVDEQGRPQQVAIARPAGLGLDEKAIEAVKGYRFRPATQNGQPVKVDLYINVNFQIF